MKYTSDKLLSIAVGLIVGTIGLFILFMYYCLQDQNIPIIFPVFGVIACLISIISFTYRNTLIVDTERMEVIKRINILFWSKTEKYHFSDFKEVGINSAGGGGGSANIGMGTHVVYKVVLIGNDIVKVPGQSSNYDKVKNRGQEIAGLLNLPYDSDPMIGFFSKRF